MQCARLVLATALLVAPACLGASAQDGASTKGEQSGDPPREDEHASFLLGEWTVEVPDPTLAGVTVRVRMRYSADRSYRGSVRTTGSFGGPKSYALTQALGGSWLVEKVSATRFKLVTRDPNVASTAVLDIVDRDHLRNEEAGYTAVRTAP